MHKFVRDNDLRYKHNFHIAVSLSGHLCDKFANFGLILKIYLATVDQSFVRVSHLVPTNVRSFSFIFIRTTVARHL